MTCTCFAKDYSPTRMIKELKQPRQQRQQEPRNATGFNKWDGIVVLLINRRDLYSSPAKFKTTTGHVLIIYALGSARKTFRV